MFLFSFIAKYIFSIAAMEIMCSKCVFRIIVHLSYNFKFHLNALKGKYLKTLIKKDSST